MKKVIILRGLQASGKSSWAKQLVVDNPGMYKRICKDDLRSMLDGGRWSGSNEDFVLKLRDDLILKSLAEGKYVIVDDTNLNPTHEARIRQLLKENKISATIEIKDFTDVPIEECIKRDNLRANGVGEKVIWNHYKKWLKKSIPLVKFNSELENCIICDLDGTLAINDWRNPYDASECEKDQVNEPILNIVRAYVNWLKKTHIFLVSGREEKYIEQTKRWLDKVFYDFKLNKSPVEFHLFMRKTGDTRKDSIVKQEIYESI